MKKKIVTFMALCLTILLAGCSSNKASNVNNTSENSYLVFISREALGGLYIHYYYDKETKVMYVGAGDSCGFSIIPLYNADGTLRLYKEEENNQ